MYWGFFLCTDCDRVMSTKNTEMVHIKNRDNLVRGICGDCLKNKVEYLKHRELAKKHLESLRANRKGSQGLPNKVTGYYVYPCLHVVMFTFTERVSTSDDSAIKIQNLPSLITAPI